MSAARGRLVPVLLAAAFGCLAGLACSSASGQGSTDATTPAAAFPCGDASCDPAAQYCAHFVDGLNAGALICQPLPGSCAGHAADCACLPDGGAPFCTSCQVVTASGATGLKLDCPGPID
jgi:hypothetical protein